MGRKQRFQAIKGVSMARTNRAKQGKKHKPPKDTPCGYCFEEWATGWDHILPWVAGGSEEQNNLYPCCKRCNNILNSRIFDSLEAKREYVRNWRLEHGDWRESRKSSIRR
jgi:5-methylcytosine-specific restriction endonuclease McrA